MAEYRARYAQEERTSLKNELAKINEELARFTSQSSNYSFPSLNNNNNFFQLDRWLVEKFLLIGGCIGIGILIGYLIMNNKKCS